MFSERPRNLISIVPLLRRAQARDLVLLGAEDAEVRRARRQRRVGLVEPHVGEGREGGQRGAVVGALDHPVGVDARQGGAVCDGDGVGVELGEVGDCSVFWS